MDVEVYIEEVADKSSYILHNEGKSAPKKEESPRKSTRAAKIPSPKKLDTDLMCHSCFIVFSTKKAYDTHIKKVHAKKTKKYMCRDCQKSFKELHEIKEHLKIHAREKPYKCRICGVRFPKNSLLVAHVRHHQKTPRKAALKAIASDALNEEEDSEEEEEEVKPKIKKEPQSPPGQVSKVGKSTGLNAFQKSNSQSFKVEGGLILHKCAHCDAYFFDPKKLTDHLDDVHKKRETFYCKFCNAQLPSEMALYEHEEIHEKNSGFYFIPNQDLTHDHESESEEEMDTEDLGLVQDIAVSEEGVPGGHIPSILDDPLFQEVMTKNKIYRTLSTSNKPCFIILPKKIAAKKGMMTNNADIKVLNISLLMDSNYPNILEEVNALYKNLKTTSGEEEEQNHFQLEQQQQQQQHEQQVVHQQQQQQPQHHQQVHPQQQHQQPQHHHVQQIQHQPQPHHQQIHTVVTDYHMKPNEVAQALHTIQPQHHQTITYHHQGMQYQELTALHNTVMATEMPQPVTTEEITTTAAVTPNASYVDEGVIASKEVLSQPYSFICNFCKCLFQSLQDLNEHFRNHEGEKPIPCDFCARWYKSRTLLQDHMSFHTADRPYRCEYCARTFAKTSQLKYHIEHKHIGDQRTATRFDPENTTEFYCKLCDKLYMDSTFKKAHMNEHSNMFNTICHQCGQTFKDENTIQRHLPVHLHEPEVREKKQGGPVPKINAIIKCVERPTKNKNAKCYPCTICTRKFTTKKNLALHEKLHSKYRYKCKMCGLKFMHFADYKSHLTIHSNEMPYKCSVCLVGFNTEKQCSIHIQHNHSTDATVITRVTMSDADLQDPGEISPEELIEGETDEHE